MELLFGRGGAHTNLTGASQIYAPMKYYEPRPPNKSSVIQCDNEHKTHYQSIFNLLFVLPYMHINDLPPVLIVVSFRSI